MCEVVTVGKLDNYEISMYTEHAESLQVNQEPDGGYLNYKGLHFGEYKFTTGAAKRLQPRIFGNWIGNRFYLCLVGNHKGKTYDGYTYDSGSCDFSVDYSKTNLPEKKDKLNEYLEYCVRQAITNYDAKKQTKSEMDLPPSYSDDESD